MLSVLPIELEEELLSRLPVTCLGKLRSTCKKWNTLTKGESFCLLKKKQKKQRKQRKKVIEVLMLLDYRVSLMSVHVDLLCPTIERIGNLDAADGLNISKIFRCDGFYLCITKDKNELLVWNPHLGQARWIDPSKSYHRDEKYALGYGHDKEDKKVLRFVSVHQSISDKPIVRVYSLKSNSWKMIDDNSPDWRIPHGRSCVSLKGNTYWYAQQKLPLVGSGPIPKDHPDFLLSFDFKREKLGPRLPLPFASHIFLGDTVTLSSVGEEQLAVLLQAYDLAAGTVIRIWITNKIEPDEVSWGNLLVASVIEPGFLRRWRPYYPLSFFVVDEDNKVAVVLFKMKDRNVAYVIGNNGYLKTVDLGESINKGCFPLVCSYLPSSLQIP